MSCAQTHAAAKEHAAAAATQYDWPRLLEQFSAFAPHKRAAAATTTTTITD